MVRIASASQQEDPNAALLQGMQMGQVMRQAQAQRAALEQQQMNRQVQMQHLHLQMQKLALDRQKMLQERAGQGDIQALQELTLKAKEKPSQGMVEAGQIIMGHVPQKFRAQAFGMMKEIIGFQQEQEHKQEATNMIQDLVKSGYLDEAGQMEEQAYLDTGGSAASSVERLGGIRKKKSEEAAITEENMQAMQGVMQRVEAMPPGPAREKARARLKEFEATPSKHGQSGFGASTAGEIDQEMIAGQEQRGKQYEQRGKTRENLVAALQKEIDQKRGNEPLAERLRQQLQMGQYGETTEQGQIVAPNEPSGLFGRSERGPSQPEMTTGMQRHTQHQMTEKEKRYPGSTEPYQKRKFFRETATKGGETRGNLSAAEKQIEQTLKNSIPHKARNGLSLEPLKQAKSEDDVLNFLEGIGAPLTPETLTAAANYWRRGGG